MAGLQMARPSNADPDNCCGGPHKAGGHDHSHGHSHSHSGGECCGPNDAKKKKKKRKDAKTEEQTQGSHDHTHEHSEDADNEFTEEEGDAPKGKRRTAEKASSGYNFAAIAILMLFVIPVVFSGFIYVMDFLYPAAAKTRMMRERVTRCYEVANPTKLQDIDKFIERYKGREHVLFAQLRAKYEKFPECQY